MPYEDAERLRAKYEMVRATARVGSNLVREVVSKYTIDLDEFIEKVHTYLEASTQLDDLMLQRIVLRLPILVYRASEKAGHAALESVIAKAAHEQVYNNLYQHAPEGTIPEKTAYAKLKAADETEIVDLAKQVHAEIKDKIEAANSLFDAVRKVMSARDTDKQIFGREQKR